MSDWLRDRTGPLVLTRRMTPRPRRLQRVGFAPWRPLPAMGDDPEWDMETCYEQAARLCATVLPDDDGDDGLGCS